MATQSVAGIDNMRRVVAILVTTALWAIAAEGSAIAPCPKDAAVNHLVSSWTTWRTLHNEWAAAGLVDRLWFNATYYAKLADNTPPPLPAVPFAEAHKLAIDWLCIWLVNGCNPKTMTVPDGYVSAVYDWVAYVCTAD